MVVRRILAAKQFVKSIFSVVWLIIFFAIIGRFVNPQITEPLLFPIDIQLAISPDFPAGDTSVIHKQTGLF
jgi:hypothetical protein